MKAPEIDLYSFFNSSTTYRVRIALGLKNLEWRHIGVNLRKGEQHAEAYRGVNPAGLVPVLNHDDRTLTQSLAIIDYLDWLQPEPLLIPQERGLRTEVLEISLCVACEMHPLNNMRVQRYLRDELRLTDDQCQT
ncbi:glutathione S-transferase N-terminal domain-containing protein [Variovorax sp. RA8]|uniref:glutathione S-transferase N-terminal domain-containing protein n=1 Tax=Variovorax sp. (strain JCM 16519 / RA8) TaxID=662548 RepID=UPI0013180666|nr:Maleylpyruvate isomerase [Variovorax sp. RA8]